MSLFNADVLSKFFVNKVCQNGYFTFFIEAFFIHLKFFSWFTKSVEGKGKFRDLNFSNFFPSFVYNHIHILFQTLANNFLNTHFTCSSYLYNISSVLFSFRYADQISIAFSSLINGMNTDNQNSGYGHYFVIVFHKILKWNIYNIEIYHNMYRFQ